MPESGNLLVIHSGWVHSQADDANRVFGGKARYEVQGRTGPDAGGSVLCRKLGQKREKQNQLGSLKDEAFQCCPGTIYGAGG